MYPIDCIHTGHTILPGQFRQDSLKIESKK